MIELQSTRIIALSKFLEKEGIRQEFTVVYTPEQNGASERDNGTNVKAAQSMLHASNMHICFLGEAVMAATYILNRTGTCTVAGKTPFEAWHNVKPSVVPYFVAHLRVFGSDAYSHIPEELRKKLEPKSRKSILVGYSETSKAYRLWDVQSHKIVEARDKIVNEDPIPNPAQNGTGAQLAWYETRLTAYRLVN